MTAQEIFLPFVPIPKGRPRFTRSGHAYTPKRTSDFECSVADYYKKHGGRYYEGAISIRLIFSMPIPKSFTKTVRQLIEDGLVKHTKKPDLDNLCKAVLDGLNGVAFKDDSQITHLSITKQYATRAGIWLVIREDVE